ncbi:hypothetical protein AU189_11485 [Mycolicibacterium acapulense]|nr:hypothetical protein AU189_11485 [Mycolicibacterium acapulense]
MTHTNEGSPQATNPRAPNNTQLHQETPQSSAPRTIISLGDYIADHGLPTVEEIEAAREAKEEWNWLADNMTDAEVLEAFDAITQSAQLAAEQRQASIEQQTGARPRYGDIAALLDGTLPEPPKPSLLTRTDGHAIFYRGALNLLFGDPEAAKSWIAFATIAETLNTGGTALFADLDHNGMPAVVSRLLKLGAPKAALADHHRFRYIDTDDPAELAAVVTDCTTATVDSYGHPTHPVFIPDIAVLDCAGEIMAAHGKSSDNADEFTHVVQQVMRPLVETGTGVVLIDHMSRGQASRKGGAGGTIAKRRIVDGLAVEARIKRPFVKGRGGITELIGLKDRHSGVREHSASMPDGRFNIGQFELTETDEGDTWHVAAPTAEDAADDAGIANRRANDYLPAALALGVGGAEFTVRDLARQRFGGGPLERSAIAQARRGMTDLADAGVVHCTHEGSGTSSDPARYTLTEAHLGPPGANTEGSESEAAGGEPDADGRGSGENE